MDAMISYSDSNSDIQDSNHTNSGSPLVLFPQYDDDNTDSNTSLNSEPLFWEDDYATSDSDRDELNNIPTNNNENHFIINNKKDNDNKKSCDNYAFWHHIKLLLQKVIFNNIKT